MNPLDNLYAYVRQSTRKREIMSEETARIVALYVSRFFSDVDACLTDSITLRNQLRAWLIEKRNEHNDQPLLISTKQLIAKFVGGYCKDCGWLSDADYTKLQRAFKPSMQSWSQKALTDDDVSKIIDYFTPRSAGCYSRSRDLLSVMIMLSAGCRIGQITALKQDDVTITDTAMQLSVILQKKAREGKSKKQIPLSVKIGGLKFETAAEWYERLKDSASEFYFYNRQREKLTTDYFRYLFQKAEKRLGFSFSAHSFRHTAGTRTAKNVGIVQAALLLDHESIQTTQRYVSAEEDTSDIIHKSFNN